LGTREGHRDRFSFFDFFNLFIKDFPGVAINGDMHPVAAFAFDIEAG
jgi:hypothetical protein